AQPRAAVGADAAAPVDAPRAEPRGAEPPRAGASRAEPPRAGAPRAEPRRVRQLYCVIDAPPATYLLTYGDDSERFDPATADRLLAGFSRAGAHDVAASSDKPAAGTDAHASADASADASAAAAAAVPPRPYGCAACEREQPRD